MSGTNILNEVYVPDGYTLIKDDALDTLLLNSLKQSDVVMTINNSIDANATLFKKVMDGLKEDVEWMESNSKNITEFKEKIDLYTKVNPMTTESNMSNLMDAIKSITKEFDVNAKGLPVGGTKELTKEIIRDRATTYMTNIGDDARSSIKNILEQSINNEQGMRYARDEMNKTIDGMSRNRAEVTARTETVNARNQAELLKAQDAGKEYFIVISAGDCCDECFDAYDGNVFHLPEDEDMLPPLHPNCRCTASFFRSESNAESMADDISKPRDEEE
jgi:SPP1 gp7 family putative phage head morphogenesis protein